MARVGDGYERRVELRGVNQQDVSVNTNADTFGASVGRGMQQAGEGVYKVAEAIDFKKQLEEDASAREAFQLYRREQREALKNPEDGYLNRTGGNAVGVQKDAEERLGTLRKRHAEGLSERGRKKYDELVDAQQDQAHAQLLNHTSEQSRNYIVNQHKSTIDGYIEDAATEWADEDLFWANTTKALDEQSQLATLQGWDEATLEAAEDQLLSGAARNRIVYAAAEDPVAAQELLDASRDILSQEDEHALDTDLKPLVLEAKADSFVQDYVRQETRLPSLGVRGVKSGQRETAKYNAEDRAGDGVDVEFSMGPGRPERPNQEIVDMVASAARATWGEGTRVTIRSGAEGSKDQHGSARHQTGAAADFVVTRPDGTTVSAGDKDAKDFMRASVMAGVTGVGFGEGYMGGKAFHMDYINADPAKNEGPVWGTVASGMKGELVALMDKAASDVLKQSSREDTSTNRQLLAHLGMEQASTLIDTASKEPSALAKDVLPPELLKSNPAFAGMTVGEVYDTLAAAIGDDPEARTGGRMHFDAAAAYEDALQIEDPDLRAKVIAGIDSMATLQNKAQGERREEVAKAAWDEYVETGRSDFPPKVKKAMGQSGWTAFESAVVSDQAGSTSTDPDTHEMLTRMASSEPGKFAELNLSQHYPNLSAADRKHFVATQESVKSALRGDERSAADARNSIDYGKVYDMAEPVYNALIDDTAPAKRDQENKQERLRFQQKLQQLTLEFYDREGREPNEAEVRDMAAVMALPTLTKLEGAGLLEGGGFNNVKETEGYLFQAADRPDGATVEVTVEYEDIPTADRARIASALTQATGELPSSDEIVETYEREQLMSVGLPPMVDISSVPEWLIEVEKGDNPDVTDEELVEKYQLYLMSQ